MGRWEQIGKNAISKIIEVELDGMKQKILIEGKRADLPIVIYLHGGPGNPLPLAIGTRGLNSDFTKHCILVLWDQFGCGINNQEFPDPLDITLFQRMAMDLIVTINELFPKNPIYIFAVSYGSILASFLAIYASDYIEGIVVYGQVLHSMIYNEEIKEAILLSQTPDELKALYLLCLQKPELRLENTKKFIKVLRKYTFGLVAKDSILTDFTKIIWACITSPDYQKSDVMAMFCNSYTSNPLFLDEMISYNLERELRLVRVPYHILQGEFDLMTSTRFMKEYMLENQNINLSLEIVDNSSHIPSHAGVERIVATLLAMFHSDNCTWR